MALNKKVYLSMEYLWVTVITKIFFIFLIILFLTSCSGNEELAEEYVCRSFNYGSSIYNYEDQLKFCGPATNKACKTKSGESGKQYIINNHLSSRGSCNNIRFRYICLTDQKVAQLEIDPFIRAPEHWGCISVDLF